MSAGIQVFLIHNYSVNGCIFDVPVGGSELRIFLFCHFDHVFLDKNFMSLFPFSNLQHTSILFFHSFLHDLVSGFVEKVEILHIFIAESTNEPYYSSIPLI